MSKYLRTAIRTEIILDLVPAIRRFCDLFWLPLDGDIGPFEDEAVCEQGSGQFSAVGAVAEGLVYCKLKTNNRFE